MRRPPLPVGSGQRRWQGTPAAGARRERNGTGITRRIGVSRARAFRAGGHTRCWCRGEDICRLVRRVIAAHSPSPWLSLTAFLCVVPCREETLWVLGSGRRRFALVVSGPGLLSPLRPALAPLAASLDSPPLRAFSLPISGLSRAVFCLSLCVSFVLPLRWSLRASDAASLLHSPWTIRARIPRRTDLRRVAGDVWVGPGRGQPTRAGRCLPCSRCFPALVPAAWGSLCPPRRRCVRAGTLRTGG